MPITQPSLVIRTSFPVHHFRLSVVKYPERPPDCPMMQASRQPRTCPRDVLHEHVIRIATPRDKIIDRRVGPVKRLQSGFSGAVERKTGLGICH